MFDRYQISNVVKNRELLRSFTFERIVGEDKYLLHVTKTTGSQPLFFILDMDAALPWLWNLLGQHFFPSSVSILSKLGKRFMDNYYGNLEEMKMERLKSRKLLDYWHKQMLIGQLSLQMLLIKLAPIWVVSPGLWRKF